MLYESDPEFRRNVNELGRLSNYAASLIWGNGVRSHNIFIEEIVENLVNTGNVYIDYGPDFYGGSSYLDREPKRLTARQRRGLNGLVEEFEHLTARVNQNITGLGDTDQLNSDMVTLYLYKYVLMIVFSSSVTFNTVDTLASQAVKVVNYDYVVNMDYRRVLADAMRPRNAATRDFLRDYRAEMEDMLLTMQSIAIGESEG
jgi:hypothetical protein